MPGSNLPRPAALAAVAAFALGWGGAAFACTVSAQPVAFGNYSAIAPAPLDGVGAVIARCHPNVHNFTISVSAGGSGTFAQRRMANGVHRLNYNLYTSAARVVVLGTGAGGSATLPVSGGTVSAGVRTFNVPIHGRIFAGQQVAEGPYSDLLFITVTY
jgi:spore coat protein U-like protein